MLSTHCSLIPYVTFVVMNKLKLCSAKTRSEKDDQHIA